MRQTRNYGALHDTHREVPTEGRRLNSSAAPGQEEPAPLRQPRNYGALHETQHQVDQQQNSPEPEERAEQPGPLRSWTHYGGMVPQQASAMIWHQQNIEIRMAESDKPGAEREGEGAESSQSDQELDQAELQEAQAAIQETRQREATERARQQERERSGPER